MVRHWQRSGNRKLLEQDVKTLLTKLVKTFKNKFEGRLNARLGYLQKKLKNFEFEYESERIPYTIEGDYIPDWPVKLPTRKFYIEGKGYFRPESKRKLVAVKKQHPGIDIRIVFYSARRKDIKWAEKHGFIYAVGTIPEEWFVK